MKFFLNIFGGKTKTTEEKLLFIAETLKKIDEKRKVNLDNEKRLIGSLLLYSFMAYFMCTAIFLIYVKPSETQYWAYYLTPLIVFPFIIFYVKRFIHWIYVRRLRYADERLTNLKTERKELLTTIIEKETYKRANELLRKFDPGFEFRKEYEGFEGTKLKANIEHNSDSEINKKGLTSKLKKNSSKTVSVTDLRPNSNEQIQLPQSSSMARTELRPPMEGKLPRPLLKQERTAFEKIIDFIVGDGFDYRYALICKHCHSHNGMALVEEFEFLSFHCAYCMGFNPARKLLPDPPKIFNLRPIESLKKLLPETIGISNPQNNDTEDSKLVHRQRPLAD